MTKREKNRNKVFSGIFMAIKFDSHISACNGDINLF